MNNNKTKIEVYCDIHPSEDPQKIQTAVMNIFPNCDIKTNSNSLKAISTDPNSLEKIHQTINSKKSHKVYRRQLKNNLYQDTTWFYLNKQAAFVNTISICEDAEESPLGPIKIIIHSKRIDDIVNWLVTA